MDPSLERWRITLMQPEHIQALAGNLQGIRSPSGYKRPNQPSIPVSLPEPDRIPWICTPPELRDRPAMTVADMNYRLHLKVDGQTMRFLGSGKRIGGRAVFHGRLDVKRLKLKTQAWTSEVNKVHEDFRSDSKKIWWEFIQAALDTCPVYEVRKNRWDATVWILPRISHSHHQDPSHDCAVVEKQQDFRIWNTMSRTEALKEYSVLIETKGTWPVQAPPSWSLEEIKAFIQSKGGDIELAERRMQSAAHYRILLQKHTVGYLWDAAKEGHVAIVSSVGFPSQDLPCSPENVLSIMKKGLESLIAGERNRLQRLQEELVQLEAITL